MIPVPIFSLVNPVQVNDWFLSVVLLTLLLMFVIMGPCRVDFIDSVSSMLRFKNPDGDVSYPLIPTQGYAILFLLSCIGVGVSVSVYMSDVTQGDSIRILPLLWYSLVALVCFMIRLLLYSGVNRILYGKQVITLKPGRWNCFFLMTFSVAGMLILLFSILVFFFDMPVLTLLFFAVFLRAFVISGRIFKIKTTLFKNRRTNLGFIVYLCALEIVPLFLEFVLWRYSIGLI